MHKFSISALFLLVLAVAVAWGQAVGGTLSGRVTAAAGSGVPNAAVTITNTDTNVSQRVLTGADGSFSVAGLAPGTYRLEVETAGFKRSSQQNIQLSAASPAAVNIALEAGSMTETVEIKAAAPNTQSQDAELSLGIHNRTVREMPVIDRNHQQLAEMQTGITPPAPAWPMILDPAQNRFFSTNGQDPSSNMWMVDGVDNKEPFRGTAVRVQPSESIQQMNIASGSWRAEKGYAGGAWTNNFMRAGTNPWHGSVFGVHSNNNLRSRPSFNHAPNPQPRLTYNQFGAAVGGRIVPDKTFFFGSYEGTYNHGQNTVLTTVPTAAMAGGDLSAAGAPIFNPGTGLTPAGRLPFTGGVIPRAFISPASAALAAALPAPNLSGFTNNYLTNIPYENDWQKADARLDQHFSDRTSAFLRYGYSNLHAIDASLFGPALGGGGRNRVLAQNAVANITHSFTPSLITEFRAGYNRYDTKTAGDAGTLGYALGYAGGLPGISIPGMASFGAPGYAPMRGVNNNFNLIWNWGWHTSRHNVRAGVDIRRFRSDGFFNGLAYGSAGAAYFGPGATLSPAAGSFSPAGTFANSFASFLLGAPSATGATSFTDTPTIRQSWYGLYLSDNLQIARRLSLDIGVRWDVFSPLEPRRTGGAMFYDADFNTLNFAGVGDTGMHISRYDLNNISPRIGLAFTPTDYTVVRAGYSMNYFQTPYAFSGFSAPMASVSSGLTGGFTTAAGGLAPGAFVTPAASAGAANGIAVPNVPMNVIAIDQHTPYVQSFNFQIQQAFMQNMMFTAGYVGTLGRSLPYAQELNAAQPGAGAAGLPFTGFGRTASTMLYTSGLNNNYNSLQAGLTKRFAQGLAFQGAYTFSKALGYTTGRENMVLNPFDRMANYGPLDYDRKHLLTISHLWELPFGAGTNHLNEGVIGHMVGNWQINGIFTWATGTPLTLTADPLFCNCPNLNVLASVGGPVEATGNPGVGMNFLSPGAFSAPAAGSFGNLGRGALRGPGYRNYDMSLFRSFPIRDQYKLEFRGEVYNITNTTHWMNPVTNINSAAFGQSTTTLNGAFGRQFNLALRVLF